MLWLKIESKCIDESEVSKVMFNHRLADFFEVSMDCLLGYSSKSKQEQPKPQVFADNSELQVFYKELPIAKREAVKKLRDI